ncbi:hypothetical protein U1Q18_017660 [Sarracenia purpurea var. burkii]
MEMYCLHKLPETFDEFVLWFCEDCTPKSANQSPLAKPHSIKSSKKDRVISKGIKARDSRIKSSKGVKARHSRSKSKRKVISCKVALAEPEEHRCPSSPSQQRSEAQKNHALRVGNSSPQSKNTTAQLRTENHGNALELGNERRLISKECIKIDGEVESVRIADSQAATADLSNGLELHYHLHAEPVIDPIWRGNFNVCKEGYGLFDGVVAHLSSKACRKVWEEASFLPELLCLEMLPKSALWPKSFQRSEPCDENIALYFFSENKRVFDRLVDDMMHQELAMRAVARNAELLVFPSSELPLLYWSKLVSQNGTVIQCPKGHGLMAMLCHKSQESNISCGGKYYLWGVFRKKQAPSSNPTDQHLVVQRNDIEGIANAGEERNMKTTKTVGARSPLSPLSNDSSSRGQ